MDEPFAGIDAATETALMTLFEELTKQGKTLLIVHHDLGSVDRYFQWVLMLNTCLVAAGPVEEVFQTDYLLRTYGKGAMLLDEAAKISKTKMAGFKS